MGTNHIQAGNEVVQNRQQLIGKSMVVVPTVIILSIAEQQGVDVFQQ
jgi:hypothetical protein